MLRLEISINEVLCEDRSITAQRTVIGRRGESQVQLLDPTVSGQHALISVLMDDVTIEDLGSTNGTFVNGELVRKTRLEDGDVVEIGQHVLRCHVEPVDALDANTINSEFTSLANVYAAQANELDDDQREALDEFEQTIRRAAPGSMPVNGSGSAPRAWLRIRSGPNAGKRVELDRPHFSLGASRERLAVVAREPSGYYLVPARRKNGHNGYDGDYPRVNGERADPAGCPLYHRDLLDIGGVQMEFLFDD